MDTCGIPPAQVAFGSAGILLTIIKVRVILLCGDELLAYVYSGHDGQRPGLRRAWGSLY